jgi:hypothetical protein
VDEDAGVDKDHVGAEWMQIVLCSSTKASSHDNELFSLIEQDIVLTGIQVSTLQRKLFPPSSGVREEWGVQKMCIVQEKNGVGSWSSRPVVMSLFIGMGA